MTDKQRQLVAIMFTDIEGYTALMQQNEENAIQARDKHRQIFNANTKKHNGRVLQYYGDGTLSIFGSVIDAVICGVEMQLEFLKNPSIPVRIGIHTGEIIFSDEEIIGDAVNIASRIESLAVPGSVLISDKVYAEIKNQKSIMTSLMGMFNLKNVENPVKVYAISNSGLIVPKFEDPKGVANIDHTYLQAKQKQARSKIRKGISISTFIIIVLVTIIIFYQKFGADSEPPLEISEKSIAVLPFVDLSPDKDKEYFSDGMMEEILNHLHKISELKVTSRTSSMQYKGETNKSIKEIANELGVSNILEGSVRLNENMVRITVQLIKASTDEHLWVENYDRDFSDIFSIQSEVAQEVAKALRAEINPEAQRIIDTKPTSNTEAYNLYLKAGELNMYDIKENNEAISLYKEALELDSNFSEVYAMLGFRYLAGSTYLSTSENLNPQELWQTVKPYLEKAITINPDNGIAHRFMAWTLLWYERDFEGALKEYEETRRIFPNYSWTDYHLSLGQFDEGYDGAILNVEIDSRNFNAWQGIITSSYFAGQDPKSKIKDALTTPIVRDNIWVLTESARVYMYLGMYDQAISISQQLLRDYPEIRSPRMSAIEAISYLKTNRIDKTNQIIEELIQRSEVSSSGSPSFYLAMIYAQKGEIDLAFDFLGKAYQDNEVELYWLKVEPPFEPLRTNSRWQEMLNRIGFPD
jgi:TolB-like protein/class 3 adenylate cyclase